MTEDEHSSSFLEQGIDESTSAEDRRLFEEIKSIVYEHITKGGHDYTPDPLEYRASSIGTCSRKILLMKDIDSYLSHDEILELPMWFQNQLSDDIVEQEFGAHLSGQIIHEVIQDALSDRIVSMEKEVSKKIGTAILKGHYDLLIEYDTGEQVVIDIKSTRSPREYLPNSKHLRQLMAYQAMLGGIKGALLYVDRDSFQMSYVTQEFDTEIFSQITAKISLLASFEEKKKLPPPIPEFDYECINMSFKCQFYDYCFPDPQIGNEKK